VPAVTPAGRDVEDIAAMVTLTVPAEAAVTVKF